MLQQSKVWGLYWFVVLSLSDIITTHLLLGRGATEGNPFAVMLLNFGGEPMLYLFKIAAISVVAAVGFKIRNVAAVWIMDLLMFMVVMANLSHLWQ